MRFSDFRARSSKVACRVNNRTSLDRSPILFLPYPTLCVLPSTVLTSFVNLSPTSIMPCIDKTPEKCTENSMKFDGKNEGTVNRRIRRTGPAFEAERTVELSTALCRGAVQAVSDR